MKKIKSILSKKIKEKIIDDFKIGNFTEPYKNIFCIKSWAGYGWEKLYFVIIEKENKSLANLSSLTKQEEKLVTRLLKLYFPYKEANYKKVAFLVGNTFYWLSL